MKAIISEKGQVTIPKAIRDRLGLKPGTRIDFTTEEGRLIGQKQRSGDDKVLAVTGILRKRGGVDKYIQTIRGKAD